VTHGDSEETKRCKYHSEEWVTEQTSQKYFNPLYPSGNYTYQQVFKTSQFYILSKQRLYMCSLRSLKQPRTLSLCSYEQTVFIKETRFVLCGVRIKSLIYVTQINFSLQWFRVSTENRIRLHVAIESAVKYYGM